MRLIDADKALYMEFEEMMQHLEHGCDYDVDKVVEQVTEITDRINNYCEEIDYNIPENERSGYKMLPDIFKLREVVKAGGVNG